MENIFRNLQNDTFRKFLRQATTKKDIEELIAKPTTSSSAADPEPEHRARANRQTPREGRDDSTSSPYDPITGP
jgi:ribosomal protein L19E